MSAASPKMPAESEPSMEDILASIRRIIAEDQEAPPEPAPAPARAPARPPVEDVLDLAEVARPVRRPAPVSFDPPEIDFGAPVDFAEAPPAPMPAPKPAPAPAPQRLQAAVEEAVTERLVSRSTDETVGKAFGLLAHTVLSSNTRTLEDLVKDMLRPMLKSWLDDNLPVMVERLVRAEIERVARGC